MSDNYIEKHGEDANNLRICIGLDQDWMGADLWIDQRWREAGVRFLTDQKYTDWIANAPKGSKPWIVMFANTPLAQPTSVQPTDNMMRNLGCLAKVFKDRFNVGFMDHRISEKVFENYDLKLDYGRTTPALFIFDNGKTYPCKTGSLSAVRINKFI